MSFNWWLGIASALVVVGVFAGSQVGLVPFYVGLGVVIWVIYRKIRLRRP